MKIFLSLLLLTILATKAFAQTQQSYFAAAFAQYHHPETDSSINEVGNQASYATKMGGKIALCGGGLLIGGTALALLGVSQRQPNHQIPAYESLGKAAALTGLPLTAVGVVMFAIGKIQDATHRQRISVSGRINEIGLAYNLR